MGRHAYIICIYIYIHMCLVYVYVYVYVVYVDIHTIIHIYIYIYSWIHIYIYMYIQMHMCGLSKDFCLHAALPAAAQHRPAGPCPAPTACGLALDLRQSSSECSDWFQIAVLSIGA